MTKQVFEWRSLCHCPKPWFYPQDLLPLSLYRSFHQLFLHPWEINGKIQIKGIEYTVSVGNYIHRKLFKLWGTVKERVWKGSPLMCIFMGTDLLVYWNTLYPQPNKARAASMAPVCFLTMSFHPCFAESSGNCWNCKFQKLAGSEWEIWWETAVLRNGSFLIIPTAVYRMKMSLAGEPIYKVKLFMKMYLAAHLVWFSKVHRKSVFALEASSLGV